MTLVWRSMQAIANNQPPRKTTVEQVEEVVKKLDPKKARDVTSWKNNIILEGGSEMMNSLHKIVNNVDQQKNVPEEWQEMEIKSIHKKGVKSEMKNKRGLFLTNNVSKVYERVMKNRNDENFRNGITKWQTGGVKYRAGIDNVMTVTSVLEQNEYLKCNTYLVFTDAEKCFDKLWLQDGIHELWRCGTDIRDCVMIKKLNEIAQVVVKTPVGDTEAFRLTDIVRQGTVYGPQICIASMDKINLLGKDVITFYGPDFQIYAVVYVDDVTGMGGHKAANNLLYNCNIMEEKKKMTFNNSVGKTEYMVVPANKEEIRTVTEKVKKGYIPRVEEHKLLGTWIDESRKYGINIEKKRCNLQYMIGSINSRASPTKVGMYAVEARLRLAEIVIIPSILHNSEGFPMHTEEEIKHLESIQLTILTGILRLPQTTSYCALLMETGWWTMRGRLAYRKLMLYHNILQSDERRTIKQIVQIQENQERKTTWLSSVKRDIEKYGIELDPKETYKSTWKKEVKEKITKKLEEEIRGKCIKSTKARIVMNDTYETKDYLLSKTSSKEARQILLTRLNMNKIPANYKGNGESMCPLCKEEEGRIEHYFHCKSVKVLAEVWDVNVKDLTSMDLEKMKNISRFMEKVEIMIEPGKERKYMG